MGYNGVCVCVTYTHNWFVEKRNAICICDSHFHQNTWWWSGMVWWCGSCGVMVYGGVMVVCDGGVVIVAWCDGDVVVWCGVWWWCGCSGNTLPPVATHPTRCLPAIHHTPKAQSTTDRYPRCKVRDRRKTTEQEFSSLRIFLSLYLFSLSLSSFPLSLYLFCLSLSLFVKY